MTVLVKQTFYFQNFLQFCERPSVAVVPVFITLVFSGQDIGIIHEPLILTNVRRTIEVLNGGRAGEFQYGTYPLGDSVLPLHPIRNGKGIIPVRGVVQQADTGKGCKIPTYLLLSGISAAKDIPQ